MAAGRNHFLSILLRPEIPSGCPFLLTVRIQASRLSERLLIPLCCQSTPESRRICMVIITNRTARAGIMENGVVVTNEEGVPQGGPLSPILANVYLDKLDKELEARGLRFVRYADDCDIFVKSGKAADRVMKSIVSWLERKLFLKVNAEKTKVVRPNDSTFLGFGFKRKGGKWVCGPAKDREKKFVSKCRELLQRKKAAARSNRENFTKLNYTIRGWINYFSIGEMKSFMKEFGKWLRHRMRAIILKQWKRPRTIIRNLEILKRITHNGIDRKWILIAGNSRRGLYRRANLPCVEWLINNKMLETPTKDRPGLVNPLKYYLSLRNRCNNVAPYTRTVRTVQWEG